MGVGVSSRSLRRAHRALRAGGETLRPPRGPGTSGEDRRGEARALLRTLTAQLAAVLHDNEECADGQRGGHRVGSLYFHFVIFHE